MKLCFYSINIFLVAVILLGCATVPPQSPLVETDASTDMVNAIENATDQAFKGVRTDSRIAVIHIQTTSSDMNAFILDELQHILVNRGYSVVDRVDLDQIRQERDFQYSHEVDDNTAVSVGKFVGADHVVTGGITGTDAFSRLRLKVIDTQTTIIKGTASVAMSTQLKDIPLQKQTQTTSTLPTTTVTQQPAVPPIPLETTSPTTGGTIPNNQTPASPNTILPENADSRSSTDKILQKFGILSKPSIKIFGGYGDPMFIESCPELKETFNDVWNVGVSLEIRHWKNFLLIEPGVRLLSHRSGVSFTKYGEYVYDYFSYNKRLNYRYLEIFAKPKFEISFGNIVAIQPFTGYAAGFFLDPNNKIPGDTEDGYTSPMHSLLTGVDFVLFEHFVIGYEYDIGITNIWVNGFTEVKSHISMINIGIKF